MKRVLFVSVAVALLAAPALAQDADVDPNWSAERAALSGGSNWTFGTETYCGVGIADLGAQTGNTGHLGIQYVADGDFYWASARLAGGNTVYKFDNMGVLIPGQNFTQIPGASSDAWGYRDLASDGEFLYGGWSGGLARHPIAGGPGVLLVPGGAPGGVGTWRALAYDPDGAGGDGSLWVCSFSTALIEVRADNGNLIRSWANLDGWSLYGLAMDPCDPDMLWGYSSPNEGEVVQIDKTTGRQTGLAYFPTCVPGAAIQPGRGGELGCQIQGGLTGVPGGAFGSGNFFDLVALGQATSDTIIANLVYAVDCNSEPGDCGGCDAADMNCDGVVDALDIEPFICLLFDPNCPPCSACAGDVNGDGTVNAEDIEPFINILFP